VTRIKVGGLLVVLLGVAALSGALVSGAAPSPGQGQPASVALALEPGVIHATRGDIRSVLVLDGAVTAVDPMVVKARADGTVSKVSKANKHLAAKAVLTVITTKNGRLRVLMPQAGVVMATEIVKGQQVAVGDPLFTIAPAGYRVTVPVDPAVLYRLYERPLQITVALDRGPAPFDCPFVSIAAATSAGANPLEAEVSLVCAVPAMIRAFSGIRAQVAITTAAADNVLWLPVEAVEGAADLGRVTVVRDGRHLPQAVVLGITDGVRVEIVSGLTEEDAVLEFPDLAAPDPGASGNP
jgi:HlyD family secretion protein